MYKKRIWLDGESIFTALSMNNIEDGIEKMSTDLAGLRVPTVDKSNFVSALKLGEKADIDHSHKDYAAVGHTHSFYQLLDKIDVPNPVLLVPVVEMDNYYTKTQTYSKSEVDSKILAAVTGGTVDLSVYYSREEFDVIYVNIRKMIDGLATLSQSNAYIKLVDVYGKAVIDTKIVELTEKVQGYLKEYETKDQLFTRKEIDDMLDTIDITTNDYVAVIELSSYADLKHTYNKTYIDNSLDEKADTNHVGEHTAHYITQDDLKLKSDKGHRETPARIVFDDGDSLEEKYLKGTLVGGTKLETHVVDLFGDIKNVIEETIFGDTVQTKGFRQLGLGAAKYRVLEIEELDTFRDQHGVKINYMGEIQITDTKKLRVIPDGGRLNPLQLGLRSFLLGYDSSILLQSTINRATYDNSIVDLSMCELTVHDIVVTDHTSIDGCNTGKIYLMKGFNNILKAGHRVDQEKGIDSSYIMNLELVGTRGIHGKTDATNECGLYVYRGTRNKVRNCIFTGFNGAGAVLEEGVNLEGTRFIECVFQDSVFGVVTKDQSIYNRVEQCTFADVDHGMIIATTGNVIDGCNLKNTDVSVYGNIEFGMFLNTGYSFNSVDSKCTFRYVPHAENPSTMLFQGLSRIPNMITKARPGTVFSGVHFENIAHIGADNQAVIANSFTTVDSPRGASEIFASVGFVDGAAEKDDINMDEVFASVPKTPIFEGPFKQEKPLEWNIPTNDLVSLDGKETLLKANGNFTPEFTEDGALIIGPNDNYGFEVGVEIDGSKDTHMLEMEFKLNPESTRGNISLFSSVIDGRSSLNINEYNSFMVTESICPYTDHLVWLAKDEKGSKILYGIGRNNMSQLGIGSTAAKSVPTRVNFSLVDRVTKIVCAYANTLLLLDDGTVYGAGGNNYGSLGFPDKQRRAVYTKLDTPVDEKVVNVWSSHYTTVILTESKKLYACGYNDSGRAGVGSPDSEILTFREIKGLPTNAGDITFVSSGDAFFVIGFKNGDMYAWGYNGRGECILGNTQNPVRVPTKCNMSYFTANEGVKKIVSGVNHNLILCNDGTLFTHGRNNHGQLGISNPSFSDAAVPIPQRVTTESFLAEGENVVDIRAGESWSMILTDSNNAYATGYMNGGQFAQPKENMKPIGVEPRYDGYFKCDQFLRDVDKTTVGIKSIVTGRRWLAVMTSDDEIRLTGTVYVDGTGTQDQNKGSIGLPKGVTKENIHMYRLPCNQLEMCISKDGRFFVRQTEWVSVTWNYYSTKVWWETNDFYHWREIDVPFNPLEIEDIIGHFRGAIVLMKDGSIYENNGLNRTFNRSTANDDGFFTKVLEKATDDIEVLEPTLNFQARDIQLLHNGSYAGYHTFFKANGKLWGFGQNQYGQVGTGNRSWIPVPTEITYEFDSEVIEVACSGESTHFLTANGSIYYVGRGNHSMFGNNSDDWKPNIEKSTFAYPSKPVHIYSLEWALYTLLEDGTILVQGRNSEGQLGLGNTTQQNRPVELTFFKSRSITVREIHACHQSVLFVTSDGVYTVGLNTDAQLGVGDTANKSTPVKITSLNVEEIDSVKFLTYNNVWVKMKDGTYRAWGANHYTQITNETSVSLHISPQTISRAPNGEAILEIFPRNRGVFYRTVTGKIISCGHGSHGSDWERWTESYEQIWNKDVTHRIPFGGNPNKVVKFNVGYMNLTPSWFIVPEDNKCYQSGYGTRCRNGSGNIYYFTNKINVAMKSYVPGSLFKTNGKVIRVASLDHDDQIGYVLYTDTNQVYQIGGWLIEDVQGGRREIIPDTMINLCDKLTADTGNTEKIIDFAVVRRGRGMSLLTESGKMFSYGHNYYYGLGFNSTDTYHCKYEQVRHSLVDDGVKMFYNNTHQGSKTYDQLIVVNKAGDVLICGYNYNKFPDSGGSTNGRFRKTYSLPVPHANIKSMLLDTNNAYIVTSDGRLFGGGHAQDGQIGTNVKNYANYFTEIKTVKPVVAVHQTGAKNAVIVELDDKTFFYMGSWTSMSGYIHDTLYGVDNTMKDEKSLSVEYFGSTTKISKSLSLAEFKKETYSNLKIYMDRILNKSRIEIDGVLFDEVNLQGIFEYKFIDSFCNKGFDGAIKQLRFTCNRGE